VDKKGTRAAAESYLQFLYSREGQEIAAKNYYRPRDPDVAKAYEATFPQVQLFTVDEVFGGWRAAQAKHFNDHGVFDEIYSQ
jgi:sulfate transport system substrate-binding protein